ncbi:hypothetical protein BDY17DRAFT_251514 [Neohortaea acidophila]|uniref:MIP18 family-like domain-containing protein n=1 Tax=Neohortaea acidophila TaxID=245834 RepID=A0A6A6PRH8_9PEZI|nr:uncharacterized protein BDY17DRAFT_251514 [Neohortaea acidophila]KAF2482254.1 hypothetical protein BDY17DRAFT_251514 [Neohortaea acidophila]
MEVDNKDNANPTILNPSDLPSRRQTKLATDKPAGLFDSLLPVHPLPVDHSSLSSDDEEDREEIDEQEVYDLISSISDPEHPLSLGSLGVITLGDIAIAAPSSPRSRISTVTVLLTPTTSACSLTTVIGLGVKVRLLQALPPRFRVDVRIKEGTSQTADEVNKQLADKERVAAAMENRSLVQVVNTMLATCE